MPLLLRWLWLGGAQGAVARPCINRELDGGLRTSRFSVPQYLPHLNAQTVANSLQRGELKVFLASLNSAVIRPVHAYVVGERLLANAQRRAPFPYRIANSLLKGGGFHFPTLKVGDLRRYALIGRLLKGVDDSVLAY